MLPHPNEANLQFEGYFMIHRPPPIPKGARAKRGRPLSFRTKKPHRSVEPLDDEHRARSRRNGSRDRLRRRDRKVDDVARIE